MRRPRGKLNTQSAMYAWKKCEQVLSVNVKLEEELKVLREMANKLYHKDYVAAEKLREQWTNMRMDGPSARRVFTKNYKYQVVRHYTSMAVGERHKIATFYRLDPKLVSKWVTSYRKYGLEGLKGKGVKKLSKSIRGRLPDVGSVSPPAAPSKIQDRKMHIYLPRKDFERL